MGCPNCKPKKPLPPPIPLRYSQMHLDCDTDSDGEVASKTNNPIARKKSIPNKANTFKSKYILGDVVGVGTYATVYNCKAKNTEEVLAVKVIDKSKLDEETEQSFRQEVDLLKKLKDHPHIIECREFFEDEKTFYLVEEFADGGELFDRIAEKQVYNEKDARDLIISLLCAVQYCHELHVVHRDLKPENILISGARESKAHEDIKLADFGFATMAPKNNLTRGCGTLDYVAPEILSHKKYGKPVDMWSVGVISYILLCGHPPFSGDTDEEEMENIKAGNYEFDFLSWGYVSEDAKSFVRKLLTVDPEKRYTVTQALSDPWIVDPDLCVYSSYKLHGGSLNQSMHASTHGSPNKANMFPKGFDLNASLSGVMGVLAKSMHGTKMGRSSHGGTY